MRTKGYKRFQDTKYSCLWFVQLWGPESCIRVYLATFHFIFWSCLIFWAIWEIYRLLLYFAPPNFIKWPHPLFFLRHNSLVYFIIFLCLAPYVLLPVFNNGSYLSSGTVGWGRKMRKLTPLVTLWTWEILMDFLCRIPFQSYFVVYRI